MMSPGTPSMPYPPQFFDPFNPKGLPPGMPGSGGIVGTPTSGGMHPKYQQWAQERWVQSTQEQWVLIVDTRTVKN